jgi:hypothetical protein
MSVKGEAAFSTVREFTMVRRKDEMRTSRMVILLVFLVCWECWLWEKMPTGDSRTITNHRSNW